MGVWRIRGEKSCNVYTPDCNENTVSLQINNYPEDPFTILYPPCNDRQGFFKPYKISKKVKKSGKFKSWKGCFWLHDNPELLDEICPITTKWKDGETERVCSRCCRACKGCPDDVDA
mmetsp:Transcript_4502/g.6610  ORF Transcript_4502/g.6610 Transcript_4502/m.6610 type:complete len:117 (+) Transcript_4502:1-351(+)